MQGYIKIKLDNKNESALDIMNEAMECLAKHFAKKNYDYDIGFSPDMVLQDVHLA